MLLKGTVIVILGQGRDWAGGRRACCLEVLVPSYFLIWIWVGSGAFSL